MYLCIYVVIACGYVYLCGRIYIYIYIHTNFHVSIYLDMGVCGVFTYNMYTHAYTLQVRACAGMYIGVCIYIYVYRYIL